jgi:hypothetical protein
MEPYLDGAIALAFAIAGLFFLRFWRDTRDRLFLIFALSFWLLSGARVGLAAFDVDEADQKFYFYLLRLIAYLLILYSILEKNQFFGLRAKRRDGVAERDRSAEPGQPP